MSLQRDALWSAADQILVSALHFSLGLVVLRLSTKEGYGAYILAWSILLLALGYQNALVTTQMVVRAAALPPSDRDRLSAAMFLSQLLIYLPIAVLAILSILLAAQYAPAVDKIRPLSIAVLLALPGVALREFARSYLFMLLVPQRVAALDVVYAGVLAMAMGAAIIFVPSTDLPMAAIAAMSVAGLVSGTLALRQTALVAWAPVAESVQVFLRCLRQGLWAAGGVTVTHLQSQSYVYVLSATAGSATTAEAGAARLLMMPVSLFVVSLQRVIQPRWVGLAAKRQHRALIKSASIVAALQLAVIALWGLAILASVDWIVAHVFGEKYSATRFYVGLFVLLTAAETARSVLSTQLQVHGRFRAITLANTVTLALLLYCSPTAVRSFGESASLWAQIGAEICLAVLLIAALLLTLRRLDRPQQ